MEHVNSPLSEEDRHHVEWMADKMRQSSSTADHWDTIMKDAAQRSSQERVNAMGWRDRILSLDPNFFNERTSEEGGEVQESSNGRKLPYGYWSNMALELLKKYGPGNFDKLRDRGMASGMLTAKTPDELEPLRFALHGLVRRSKAVSENGTFSMKTIPDLVDLNLDDLDL